MVSLANLLFLVLGILQWLVALLHFIWPRELGDAMLAVQVPGAWQDFVLLLSTSVGLLLAALGTLALWFTRGQNSRTPAAGVFSILGGMLWVGRAVLEWRFPVRVPLLGSAGLSPVILAGALLIAALYGLAFLESGTRGVPCPVSKHPWLEKQPFTADYQDAYAITLPAGATLTEALAAFCCAPGWLRFLMWARDQFLARPLGLERIYPEFRRRMERGEIFHVIEENGQARLMGEPDAHLDFQVLAEIEQLPKTSRLVLTTRVHFNNLIGRLYFIPVRYGHRWIVTAMLGRAAERLWQAAL